MRAAKWGLSVVLGLAMSIGAWEASSQQTLRPQTLVRVCNQSNVVAYATLTAHPAPGDARFLITGWYRVDTGNCREIRYAAPGWIYLYAESEGNPTVWRGNDQRFCVAYPGPYQRYISDDYQCSGELLKGFTGYYVQPGTFTWNLH
jgi:uncharacterized membrane protein